MSQPGVSTNIRLIESLAQIILSLTDEERQLLEQKICSPQLSPEEEQLKRVTLQRDLAAGVAQLQQGELTEYDDASLPSLLIAIQNRGRQKLQQTQAQ